MTWTIIDGRYNCQLSISDNYWQYTSNPKHKHPKYRCYHCQRFMNKNESRECVVLAKSVGTV